MESTAALVVTPKTVRARIDRVPVNERKRGSRDAYHPEMVSELAELTAAGWNDVEIAELFNVSVRALYRWKLAHADFARALQFNDKEAVARVKGAFFAKATGFNYVEQQAIKIKTGEHTEAVEVIDVVKYQPPDTTAGIFFLKNRDRENWRDVQDVNVAATVDLKSADMRALALSLLATIQAGLAAPVIEHEATETTDGTN